MLKPSGLFFDLLMLGVLLTPFAVLLEFDFSFNQLAVLAAPIIDALTSAAGQLDQLIL